MKSGISRTGIIAAAGAFLLLIAVAASAQNQPAGGAQPAAAQPAGQAEPAANVQPSDIGGWRVSDFEPYVKSLKELEKVGKEYSETVLKQAIDEYATGIDLLQDMESEILKTKAAYDKKNNLNERWYWQEIDRKNEQARHIARLKVEAKMKSITHFTRAINYLDNIQSIEVRSDKQFINFQIRLFQAYVSTQYDMHNLKPCIPILERYITINEKTKNDVWAYKYMSSCYGFMENLLVKSNQGGDDIIQDFKQKKNRALLFSAELAYGIESPQYKQLKEVVELDEKKTEKISDFK
jgi:hypothetical protein